MISTSRSRACARRARRSTGTAAASCSPRAPRVFLVGRPDLDETIRRLQAFAAAGADCLYAPACARPS